MTTREEFEAWIARDSRVVTYERAFEIEANSEYYWPQIEWSWQAWKASRTAALEEAAKECETASRNFWLAARIREKI